MPRSLTVTAVVHRCLLTSRLPTVVTCGWMQWGVGLLGQGLSLASLAPIVFPETLRRAMLVPGTRANAQRWCRCWLHNCFVWPHMHWACDTKSLFTPPLGIINRALSYVVHRCTISFAKSLERVASTASGDALSKTKSCGCLKETLEDDFICNANCRSAGDCCVLAQQTRLHALEPFEYRTLLC